MAGSVVVDRSYPVGDDILIEAVFDELTVVWSMFLSVFVLVDSSHDVGFFEST